MCHQGNAFAAGGVDYSSIITCARLARERGQGTQREADKLFY